MSGAGSPAPPGHRRSGAVVALLTAALVLPLVVGLITYRQPTWRPVLDLAQTELRVRDVGTAGTPLVGLPGRIGTEARQGSHPGPLSFYALAPVYRALGGSSWALQVATVAVHGAAIAAALALALRRGGWDLAIGVSAALALLILGYGAQTMSVPWNPYLPLLWWVVVLLAAWSVVCRDWMALPVLVVAGSFCGQTHIPYLGLSLGLGVVAVAVTVPSLRRAGPEERSSALRWGLLAVAAGALAWMPPTLDQLVREPGNYSILLEHFGSPDEEPIGLVEAATVVVRNLDLAHLLVDQLAEPGTLAEETGSSRDASGTRGAAFLALWAATAGAALWSQRRGGGHNGVLALNVVVAVALVLGLASLSRVFGVLWYYLSLWVWGIGALMAVATVMSAGAVLERRRSHERDDGVRRVGLVLAAVLAVTAVARLAADAPADRPPDAFQSEMLSSLLPDTIAAIEDGLGRAEGRDGRYLVTWDDAAYIGSTGYGLVNELERAGFDVGVPEVRRVVVTPHRVLPESQATARVVLATGVWVERWEKVPSARRAASIDPRSAADRAEYDRLRREVIERLRRGGRADAVERVDLSLFGLAIDQSMPDDVTDRLARMLELGVPFAVFIAAPGAFA